jgi:pimeloyl-ACP methyl ester carboxylesterase
MEGEVEALNDDPSPIAELDVDQIVEHYARIIDGLDKPPIIMGHSLGGTIMQVLLDRGLGAAGVGVASGTVKGVPDLPLSTLRTTLPALRNPFKRNAAVPLAPRQFHYAFTNTLSEEESDEVYERYHVPCAVTVLREAAFASLHRDAPTKVDFANDDRAPLLFITFEHDHTIPPERQPPQRREVLGLASDHRVPGVPGASALPWRARLGGARRPRRRVGRQARRDPPEPLSGAPGLALPTGSPSREETATLRRRGPGQLRPLAGLGRRRQPCCTAT